MKNIKKVITIFLVMSLLLVGCSSDSNATSALTSSDVSMSTEETTTEHVTMEETTTEEVTSNVDIELLDLAKNAKTAEEVEAVLSKDSSVKIQLEIARSCTYEGQKALLNLPDLAPEALVAICQDHPELYSGSSLVQRWFRQALRDITLSEEQEIALINTGDSFILDYLLWYKYDKLSPGGLVALCQYVTKSDNANDSNLLDFVTTRQLDFQVLIEAANFSKEQEVAIAKIGHPVFNKALLMRYYLSYERLLAICENSKELNLTDEIVQDWFYRATKRLVLTEEQRTQLAQTENPGVLKALAE